MFLVLHVGHGARVRSKWTAHHGHSHPKEDPSSTDEGHAMREEGSHEVQVRPFHIAREGMPTNLSSPSLAMSSSGACKGWVRPKTTQ